MNKLFKQDLYRIEGHELKKTQVLKRILFNHQIKFLYLYRMNNIIGKVFRRHITTKYGLEIYSNKIGGGLYLCHPYSITVNSDAVIGNNCNLCKGCTIGQENRGVRKGTPILGNSVWVGTNAVIVGKITIGDNVLIAPNAYVNRDIPSNSIVFGNPCQIKSSDEATKSYINNSYPFEK